MNAPTTNDIFGEVGWISKDKRTFIENTLKATNRKGVDSVTDFLSTTDFYTAPASTIYHCNYRGGLVDHVLSVYSLAMKIRDSMVAMKPEFSSRLTDDSIAIVALLHDLCKVNFYQITPKWKKGDDGQWENYEGYKCVDTMPFGHGEKSVFMLQFLGFELTMDEMLAIRWHMGMYNDHGSPELRYSQLESVKMSPLVSLLQMADYTSTMILEKTIDNN